MRIGGEGAAGDDGFFGNTVEVEQGVSNGCANHFGGEVGFSVSQQLIASDRCRRDLRDGGFHSGDSGALGLLYGFDFFVGFDFALRAGRFFCDG